MEQKRPFWIELVFPAVILVLAVIYYFNTLGFSRQAVFFPHSMMVVMAVLAAVVLTKEYLDRRGRPAATGSGLASLGVTRNALLIFALSVAYYGLIIAIGYFIATGIFLLVSLFVFGVHRFVSIALALGFTGVLYLVFAVLFDIRIGS
ncbi:tripartite tricarboxylate transporter TctB family protein [Acuticoccus kandeliae]|uniref:tripartite tricarboxylate transporter TctB family protein n=1 Tax=Acuticoccus kandeliae TaxID=2073160 RepID=UPI000D3E8168|nr:tripartite tricarboxylate transporter TctB family protein [Acuticoccus kandeliae]